MHYLEVVLAMGERGPKTPSKPNRPSFRFIFMHVRESASARVLGEAVRLTQPTPSAIASHRVTSVIASACRRPSSAISSQPPMRRQPNPKAKSHEGHRHLPTTNNITRRQQWLVPLFRQTSCANFAVKKRCAGLIGCHLGWCLGLHNGTIRGRSRRWWSGGQAIAA